MPDQNLRTVVTEITISRLARDIARDIVPVTDILKTHHLSVQQYEGILNTKIFQTRLEEEVSSWASNGRERIAAKAMAIVEEGLLELFDLIHDRAQPMTAKIEALKFTAKLAAMENGATELDPDDKIVFNITINGQRKTFEDRAADPAEAAKVIDGEVTQLGNTP
jgi:hypothetical protein